MWKVWNKFYLNKRQYSVCLEKPHFYEFKTEIKNFILNHIVIIIVIYAINSKNGSIKDTQFIFIQQYYMPIDVKDLFIFC